MKKIVLSQDLIVDKTELRVRDAVWLRNGMVEPTRLPDKDYYPSLELSKIMDYPISPGEYIYRYQEMRSEKDGLDNTFKRIPVDKIDTTSIRFRTQINFNFIDVFDTTSNGYRMPTREELKVLQLGGKESSFFWEEKSDESVLRGYMSITCASTNLGVYPVKLFAANPFGLYDVYGNAEEESMLYHANNIVDNMENRVDSHYDCEGFDEMLGK